MGLRLPVISVKHRAGKIGNADNRLCNLKHEKEIRYTIDHNANNTSGPKNSTMCYSHQAEQMYRFTILSTDIEEAS
jgi:hypothetical protein